MKRIPTLLLFLGILGSLHAQNGLILDDRGYFHMNGLDIAVFSDYYPEGHQSGITVIQHGNRVAANGDLRLEPTPGQWSPVPKEGERSVDVQNQTISQTMWYPDSGRNGRGFNPIEYPDLTFRYRVTVQAVEMNQVSVVVDLEEPLPEAWAGKIGFNLELFPGDLFGKSFLMDGATGLFPEQPVGSMVKAGGEQQPEPLGTGQTLVIAPESEKQRMVIVSKGNPLQLWDGRTEHNNGWFIVRSTVRAGAAGRAVEWILKPNVIPGWIRDPVIQVSQIGYHPRQNKKAVVELDASDDPLEEFRVYKMQQEGPVEVMKSGAVLWGRFLRYNYLLLDFSQVTDPGVYQLAYGSRMSHPFRIEEDVYGQESWQPTLDYYLPVQMCHMRVNEKYRVWHDLCHMDDALMAPPVPFHFDGYRQREEDYAGFGAGEQVPGLDRGGWHDAGDYDLRVESQAGTVWLLARMIEEFGLDHDATTVDQKNHVVEIHQPDGVSDAIQQIRHGLATILGGYRAFGKLYRGIICSDLRQYVMLGDASAMTDNIPGNGDDRWVFTETNPRRALAVIPALAASSRVLKSLDPELSRDCLETALSLWKANSSGRGMVSQKVVALSDLILTTHDPEMMDELLGMQQEIVENIGRCGWAVGQVIHLVEDRAFQSAMHDAMEDFQRKLQKEQRADSPYGVPYKPNIWGAGWNIQRFGVEQYFCHKGWPDLTSSEFFENALHFILGVHPGSNNASFASGIGSGSVRVAYGVNRADWSFIPGGVVSGTALIRPDFPELKNWPFLWQQTEYVMGGGATNYMFLVMAVDALFNRAME